MKEDQGVYTSMFLFAVAGLLPGVELAGPTWQTDYRRARQIGVNEQKPLAVILSSGQATREKLVLDATVRRILAENYVPVFIDTETGEGQRMAQAFDIRSGEGLILSDRSGNRQAFWHEGSLSSPDLTHYLQKYAVAQETADTTETKNSTHVSNYPSATAPAPRGTLAPYQSIVQPMMFGGFSGGFSGGCST